jgi:2-polyprenyl-6-methoxyphenol hydroxylase-like FAD-dependent oxidoreductase
MHAAIVGAGPTGLFAAIALARRGHTVTVVDRDPGPVPDATWQRRVIGWLARILRRLRRGGSAFPA